MRKELKHAILRKYVRGGNYSTSETFTGKYWIDGKEIYRKVINFGALPNNTTKLVSHGISNIGSIINLHGVAYSSTENAYLPLPYVAQTVQNTYLTTIFLQGSAVTARTYTDLSSYDAKIILEYTKAS